MQKPCALAEAQKALPDDAAPFLLAAVSLLALGDAKGALIAASETCYRAPQLPAAHYAYGHAFLALGLPRAHRAGVRSRRQARPALGRRLCEFRRRALSDGLDRGREAGDAAGAARRSELAGAGPPISASSCASAAIGGRRMASAGAARKRTRARRRPAGHRGRSFSEGAGGRRARPSRSGVAPARRSGPSAPLGFAADAAAASTGPGDRGPRGRSPRSNRKAHAARPRPAHAVAQAACWPPPMATLRARTISPTSAGPLPSRIA